MSQLSEGRRPQDLPLSVRIPRNRTMLRLGLSAALTALAVLVVQAWPGSNPRVPVSVSAFWAAFALFALIGAACAFRLVASLPVIEASELGIAIWLRGPYFRPFFAPWSRVRAVVLTTVARWPRAGARHRTALGIVLIQDDGFRIPDFRHSAQAPALDAPHADLAWSSRAIGGDLSHWVDLLQRMKAADTQPPIQALSSPCPVPQAGEGSI